MDAAVRIGSDFASCVTRMTVMLVPVTGGQEVQ